MIVSLHYSLGIKCIQRVGIIKSMRKRKLTVTIGIPAYNEEANIKNLLLSLVAQKNMNFALKEIIVVSDKSTDNTVSEIKSVKNNKIKLIENKKRLGQVGGQNKIIKIFSGDILILLNADVLPANATFISMLVSTLESNSSIGMVGPKIIPLKGQTFFENILNYSIQLKDEIFENVNNGNNLYLCRGAARAFKKEFAKTIRWKDSLSEDAFSYLSCISKGYQFKYDPRAILYIKSPDNFKDHLSQSARFSQGPKIMSRYLNNELVQKEYAIPKKNALVITALYLLRNPFLFMCYITTLLLVKIYPKKGDFAKSMWVPSASSKVLRI